MVNEFQYHHLILSLHIFKEYHGTMFRKHFETIECFVACHIDVCMVKPLMQETVIAHHRLET